MTGSRRILSSVIQSYGAQLFRILGALLFNIWLTRLLAPVDRGYYGVGLAIGSIASQFGVLGINTANTHFAARQPNLASKLLGNSTALAAVVAPLLIILLSLVPLFAPQALVTSRACLAVALLTIPFGIAYTCYQGLLLGVYQVGVYNGIEVLNRYIPLVALAILVAAHHVTAAAALAGVLASQLLAFALSFTHLRRVAGPPSISVPLLRTTLGYGLKIHLATVFSFLLFRADLLMVARIRGSADAGYYSLATVMAEYISLPAQIAGNIMLPHLSALPHSPQKFALMNKWLLGIAALMAPLFVLCAVIGRPAIPLLFGPKYIPSFDAFLWLLPGVYFLGLECVAIQFITAIGYRISVSLVWFAALVINIAANLWAIPRHGIVGASIASSICYAAAFAVIYGIAFVNRNAQDTDSAMPEIEANIAGQIAGVAE